MISALQFRYKGNKGGVIMKKEEILEKSRKSNLFMDEREKKIDDESYSLGMIGMLALVVFYSFWRMAHHQEFSDMMSIMTIEGAAVSFYKYRKMPEKKIYIICGIFNTIATIAFIAAFLWEK